MSGYDLFEIDIIDLFVYTYKPIKIWQIMKNNI